MKNEKKIRQILQRHQIEFFENNTNQWIFDQCPYCERERKLHLDSVTGQFICFSGHCGETGNVYSLIAYLENINYKEAFFLVNGVERVGTVEKLTKLSLLPVKELEKEQEEVIENLAVEMPMDYKRMTMDIQTMARYKRFYVYLTTRGITVDMMKHFDLHLSPRQERIVFPVYFEKKLVGWQGRLINDRLIEKWNPKALSQPKGVFKKGNVLYNYDAVCDKEYITIVEGPIDCLKTYKHNSVALFGKKATEQQLKLIFGMKNLKKVYIALDPEETKDITELYKKLSVRYECLIIKVEEDSDCGDKSPEEIDFYVSRAQKLNYLELTKKLL